MTTTQVIELIESSYIMSYIDKIKLLSMVQELDQYRKNPLAKMQGCKKWVKANDINEQLIHLKSEIAEFEAEQDFNKMVAEYWDIGQSWLTGMIILKIKYGVDIDKLVEEGQRKNSDRKYDI